MKIFISGSSSIKKLNENVKLTLQNIMKLNAIILVGDCDGVDSLVQMYCRECGYKNVLVYHSGDKIRNNYGFEDVRVDTDEKGREFYEAKDIKMNDDCDYGYVIWDGKSRGSKRNIERMREMGKKCKVENGMD